MPFLLLILPVLAHILLAAHLLFHGLGLFVSVLPLLAVPLLFIPKRWMVWLQSALLVLWGIEWLRSAWELILQRMAWGEPWMRAGAIVAGCGLFSWLTILVFRQSRIRNFYKSIRSIRLNNIQSISCISRQSAEKSFLPI